MRVEVSLPGRAKRGFRAALLASALLGVAGASWAGDGLEALRAKLRSSDKRARAEAVEELAHAGTKEAWALVLGALADPKGEVADVAQLALGTLAEPRVLETFAKEAGLRAKDRLVRVRAAEALGRLPASPPARWFERALEDEDAEVRRMASWSLERRGLAQTLDEKTRQAVQEELVRAARCEREPLGRVRALAAVCALDPLAALPLLEEAQRHNDALVRGAAAALLPRVAAGTEVLVRLGALAADSAPAVRRVAAEGLAGLGSRAAAQVLVERLEQESEERLVWRLVELLQRLSGLKHRRDPRPWLAWAQRLPSDWSGAASAPPPAPTADGEVRTVTTFAGLAVLSKRVTFLIDLSGSMWNVRPDGKTKKQIVDQKLREALLALPSDTRFNLIPYTGKPIPWKEKLTEATPARVREAAAWFEARKENGSGNFWDAAQLALADPDVDTLVVLFDGAPTGGVRHRLELIVPLLLEQDFARRVAFDLVLVDASYRLQRLWGELAEGTGGHAVAVSF